MVGRQQRGLDDASSRRRAGSARSPPSPPASRRSPPNLEPRCRTTASHEGASGRPHTPAARRRARARRSASGAPSPPPACAGGGPPTTLRAAKHARALSPQRVPHGREQLRAPLRASTKRTVRAGSSGRANASHSCSSVSDPAQRGDAVAEAAVDRLLGGPERRDRLAALVDVAQLRVHHRAEHAAAAVRRLDADHGDARARAASRRAPTTRRGTRPRRRRSAPSSNAACMRSCGEHCAKRSSRSSSAARRSTGRSRRWRGRTRRGRAQGRTSNMPRR